MLGGGPYKDIWVITELTSSASNGWLDIMGVRRGRIILEARVVIEEEWLAIGRVKGSIA